MQIFDIGHGQLLAFDARAGQRVRVVHGRIWLTQSGEPRDHFARGGDDIALAPRARTVIEAIGGARVIVERLRPVPQRTRRADFALLRVRMWLRRTLRPLLPQPA
jgi:hypothetical protein